MFRSESYVSLWPIATLPQKFIAPKVDKAEPTRMTPNGHGLGKRGNCSAPSWRGVR